MDNSEDIVNKLRDGVISKWTDFEIAEFNLMLDGILITTDNAKKKLCVSRPIELNVVSLAHGFSNLSKNDVLDYASIPLLCKIDDFAFSSSNLEDSEIFRLEVDRVYDELKRRAAIFVLCDSSEYTMREFISPFLVSSALIAGQIQLLCEKTIMGTKAHGPLDYLAYYKRFVICVTEAKKLQLETGMVQNIAQMKACREAFEAQVSFEITRSKRKFREIMSPAEFVEYECQLPSSGIVSTGMFQVSHSLTQILIFIY